MSFSSDVKKELAVTVRRERHCQIAELTAIITMCGGVSVSASDRVSLRIHTENRYVAEKAAALLKAAFHIRPETGIRLYARSRVFLTAVPHHEDATLVLRTCHLLHGVGSADLMDIGEELSLSSNPLLKRTCCQRAFLRGAFLSSGSISDPHRFYHFEIVCAGPEKAAQLQEIFASFGIEARSVTRKLSEVVYLKEGTQIVDALGIMEAPKALMELENIRILREISNDINRRVNCEAANISKAVATGVRQAEDICYIRDHGGLSQLPAGLEQIACLRLEHMDASLQELGDLLVPPLKKSGVNHRFEKIAAFAQKLRNNEHTVQSDQKEYND